MSALYQAAQPTRSVVSRRGFIAASAIAAMVASVGVSVSDGDGAYASWGGYSNGYIPTAILSPVPWDTVRILRTDARDALVALNEAFKANFGHNITINDGYRDFAEQVRAKAKYGKKAAEPGESSHGWAIAVDIANTSRVQISFSHPIYLWLKSNAGRYGWAHPAWAEPGGSKPEAWHWEYKGSYAPPTTTPTVNIGFEDMTFLCMTPINGSNGDAGVYRWIIDPSAGTKRNIDGGEYEYLKAVGYREVAGLQPPITSARYQQIYPAATTP